MKNTIYIYKLIDIRDNNAIYVGKTTNIKKRLVGHFNDKKSISKYEYLKENKEFIKICELETINPDDYINDYYIKEREQYYIDKHKPSVFSNINWFNTKYEISCNSYENTTILVDFIQKNINRKIKLNIINDQFIFKYILEIDKIQINSDKYYDFYYLVKNICLNRYNKYDLLYFSLAYILMIQNHFIKNNLFKIKHDYINLLNIYNLKISNINNQFFDENLFNY